MGFNVNVTAVNSAPTTPSGNVTLTIHSVSYVLSLDSNGIATLPFIPLTLGSIFVDVAYSGDSNFFPYQFTSPAFQIHDDCFNTTGVPCTYNDSVDGFCYSNECVVPPIALWGYLSVSVNQEILITIPNIYAFSPYSNLSASSLTILDVTNGNASTNFSSPGVIIFSSLLLGTATLNYSIADIYGQTVQSTLTLLIFDPCDSWTCTTFDCRNQICEIGAYPVGGSLCVDNGTKDDDTACDFGFTPGLCLLGTCVPIVPHFWYPEPAQGNNPAVVTLTTPNLTLVDVFADYGNITVINSTCFLVTPDPGYVGPILVNYTLQTTDDRYISGSLIVQAVNYKSPPMDDDDDDKLLFLLFLLIIPFTLFFCCGFCWCRRRTAPKRAEAHMASTRNVQVNISVELDPTTTTEHY